MSAQSADLRRLALTVQLAAFPGPDFAPAAARLLEHGLGGVCLFGSNTAAAPDALAMLVRRAHEAGERALVAIDEEGGDVTRLHTRTGSTSPGNAVLGVVDDVAVTADIARQLGLELAALGIDLNLAPVADVNSNPDNPIIGVRSFGSEPGLVARHVAAWVDGLQSAGVSACAKHFPGHGDTSSDSHTGLPRVDASAGVLRERELVPFAAAVDTGVEAVMTSHVLLPAIDRERPATLSPAVLGMLRTELGFEGAIVTDALDMAGAAGGGRGVPEAAVLALSAGADLLCLGADKDATLVESVADAVVDAVRGGRLPEARLRDAAARTHALARVRGSAGGPSEAPDNVAAARRALRVEGTLPRLADALVVRVDTAPTIAVGEVPWGLDAEVVLKPGAELEAGTRPVVVQVRDLHRHSEVGAMVVAITRTGREVVVIEWGWPAASDMPVPRICTYGASTASREAVRQLLRESTGWTP